MSTSSKQPTIRNEFWAGVKATFPLVVGAAPFGIIFGAVAVANGISPAGAQAMSLFVFAGSSQFIVAGLAATGSSLFVNIATTFVVNLRHMLYAVTLSPYMKDLSQRWLIPLGFWLTDETFVVAEQRYKQPDKSPHKHWFYFGSAVFMYVNWQACTLLGIVAGQQIEDPLKWGLDFALIVTFIGMLIPLIKTRPVLISVLAAGITAILTNGLPNKLGLIASALAGILGGVLAENFWPIKSDTGESHE